MAVVKHNKIKLREVNRHLVCRLCRGYYIDATTIAECLHSFCRSCIIKYLEKNSFCPICEVQIHKTKPYLNLRLDKALQDVVYKLVPGLYHDEMKRRREFYAKHQEQIPVMTPEQCGLEERIIFSPDDSISLSLEYLESDDYEADTVSSQSSESGDNVEGLSFPQQLGLMKLKNTEGRTSRRESQDIAQDSAFPKRYLQCPAVVSISHLKKFITMKHDLTDRMQVDIVHKRVPLPDHYTLMDVAYIYTWKRSAPMRFFYQICETKRQKMRISPSCMKPNESNGILNGEVKAQKEHEISCAKQMAAKSEVNLKLVASVDAPIKETGFENCLKSSENSLMKSVQSDSEKPKAGEKKRGESSESQNNSNRDSGTKDDRTNGSGKSLESSAKDKIEKTVTSGSKFSDYRNKIECTKSSNSKIVAKEMTISSLKENADERLLLNPISGQLESVPSLATEKTNQTKNIGQKAEPVADQKLNGEIAAKKSSIGETKSKSVNVEELKEVKKSSVNLLKSFRKEKLSSSSSSSKDFNKPVSIKGPESSLTITTVSKGEKPSTASTTVEKEKANVSIEIKSEKKESEYDFDGTSPPSKIIPLQEYSKMAKNNKSPAQNSWMSLQDFRLKMLKESNGTKTSQKSIPSADVEESGKKDKRKSVPSLFRIGAEGNKKRSLKTPPNSNSVGMDKAKPKKMSPTIINIKTENSDSSNKTEIKIELPEEETSTPPKPIKIESKGGEYSIKQRKEDTKKESSAEGMKSSGDPKKMENEVTQEESGNKEKESSKEGTKRNSPDKPETTGKKKRALEGNGIGDSCGAIDLSKTDTSPKNSKNPLENLMDLANKSEAPKTDENMVEALISAAQKQSIEPLLKIPHYTQNPKNCSGQGSPPLAKNISSNDISQALQFFKDLRSDIKVLEAKSQLSPNSFLEQFSQKSANLEPIQLYQKHIDLIRKLKRQQITAGDIEPPQRKHAKVSPSSESKRKSSPETTPKIAEEAAVQLKSSLERTLSQIQEQMELQSRMVAAQSYKNLPALLQFYNRGPSPAFCPGPPSPSKSRLKSTSRSPSQSQKSPNSGKSPPSLTSPQGPLPLPMTSPEASFFTAQKYSHLINAGLNSEMTFHQMFQNYLSQQDKMNQIKHCGPAAAAAAAAAATLSKKTPQGLPSGPKTLPELYYGNSQGTQKKQDCNSLGTVQKT